MEWKAWEEEKSQGWFPRLLNWTTGRMKLPSVELGLLACLALWMDLLPTGNFVASCIHWLFGKYWFTDLCISSKIDTFNYTIISHFLKALLVSSEKSSSTCKLSSLQWWLWVPVFWNPDFHLKRGFLGSRSLMTVPIMQCRRWRQGFRGVKSWGWWGPLADVHFPVLFLRPGHLPVPSFVRGPLMIGLLFHCHH